MERVLPAGGGGGGGGGKSRSRPASPPRRRPAAPAARGTHARAATFHSPASWLDVLDLSFDGTTNDARAKTGLRIDPPNDDDDDGDGDGDGDDDDDENDGDSPRVWSPNPLFAEEDGTAVLARTARREAAPARTTPLGADEERAAATTLATLLRCVMCVVKDDRGGPSEDVEEEDEDEDDTPLSAPPPPPWVTAEDDASRPLIPPSVRLKRRRRRRRFGFPTRTVGSTLADVLRVACALTLGVAVPVLSLVSGAETGANRRDDDDCNGSCNGSSNPESSSASRLTRASVALKLVALVASQWTLQATLCGPPSRTFSDCSNNLKSTAFLADARGGFAPRRVRAAVHAAYARIARTRTAREWRMLLAPYAFARIASAAAAARSLFVRGESNLKGSSPISRFWSLGRFAADVGSDVFAAASYALTCALFRVACALTLLRLNSLFVMIQNLGGEHDDAEAEDDDDDVDNEEDDDDDVDRSDVGAIVEEHAALRALVRRMAHSFRMFLVVTTLACLGECFAASLYAVSVHAAVSSDGDRRDLTRALRSAVPSALRLLLHAWGTALNLRAATLATHRMQKTGSYLSERHARITAQLCASDPRVHERVVHDRAVEAFAARHAAVGSFRDNGLGISVFGFVLDREFLRTFHAALVALVLFVAARALTAESHR